MTFFCHGGRLGCLGILNVLTPTHSPNPSLAPTGERGELHVAACLKAGTLRSTVRWPQSEVSAATSRHSQIRRGISWPALDLSGRRPETSHSDQALPQHQFAPTRLQPIQKTSTQFDGNALMRTFFPPLVTQPNVAVSYLSAPAGVERVGERGGIQRIKDKSAAHSHVIQSISINHDDQERSQTPERTIHAPSCTPAKGAP